MGSIRLIGIFAVLSLACAPAYAQGCVGDDGLASAACCSTVSSPTLPHSQPTWPIGGVFPTQDAVYFLVQNCNGITAHNAFIDVTHTHLIGDYAWLQFNMVPATSGGPSWLTISPYFLYAKYARTWYEPIPGSTLQRQIWRYLINGDLTAFPGSSPNPYPVCSATDRTHFFGHVDYACEPDGTGAPNWLMLLSLSHLPGCISHASLSAAPLPASSRHEAFSYHIVSPGAGFNIATPPSTNVPPTGPFVGEAVRSMDLGTFTPLGEGSLSNGYLSNDSNPPLCPCTLSSGPFSPRMQSMWGDNSCGTTVSSFTTVSGLPDPFPPTGLLSKTLGSYSGQPGTFPGERDLWIHFGVFYYADPCASSPSGLDLYHIIHGVMTTDHDGSSFSGAGANWRMWMDLQNAFPFFVPGAAGTYGSLGWGRTFYSVVVWNLNLPS